MYQTTIILTVLLTVCSSASSKAGTHMQYYTRYSECSGIHDCHVRAEFLHPDDIFNGHYQAITGSDLSFGCRAYKNFRDFVVNVCVGDPRPEFGGNIQCLYGTRTTCLQECFVNLTLTNIQPNNAGIYWCNGTINEYGYNITGTRIQVEVKDKQALTFHFDLPEKVSVTEDDDLILNCGAEGYPSPRYTWLHEGKILGNATDGILKINHVSHLNHGNYQCVVENRYETRKSSNVFVKVEYKGVFIKYYIIFGVVGGVLIVVCVGLYRYRHRRRRHAYEVVESETFELTPRPMR